MYIHLFKPVSKALIIISILVGATFGYLMIFPDSAKASAIPPGWSVTEQADPKVGYLNSVSCATDQYCIASDTSGNFTTYSSTTNQFSAPAVADPAEGITSVSCVSSTFCVAVDGSGNYLSYNGSQWSSPQLIDPGNSLVGVSCSSQTLCVAVDQAGNTLSFNGATWTQPMALATNAFVGISCVSFVCIAVDAQGNAFVFASGNWSSGIPGGGLGISSLSCYAAGACYAVNGAGQAILFENDTWMAPVSVDSSGLLSSISCLENSAVVFCVAADQYGNFVVFNGTQWSAPAATSLGSAPTYLSCANSNFCVMVSQNGSGVLYNGTSFSKVATIEPTTNSISWVSCASQSNCEIFDQAGRVISWNGTSFTTPSPTPYGSFASGYCSTNGCLEAYVNGYVSFGSSAQMVDSAGLVSALGCLPAGTVVNGNSLASPACLMVDQSGNVYEVSYNSSNNVISALVTTYSSGGLSGVGCQTGSAPACVIITSQGGAIYCGATYSAGGIDNLSFTCSSPTDVDGTIGLTAISCNPSICVAVDSAGQYLTLTNGSSWSSPSQLTASSSIALNAISCGPTMCMAVDQNGNSYLYQNGSFAPAGVADPGNVEPASISCPVSTFCMLVDKAGQAVTWSAIVPGVFYGEAPVRIVDTRTGATDPSTYAGQHLGPKGVLNVNVVGANSDNVPSNATAIVINVTAVHPTQLGYLTIWPTGTVRPNVSSLNFSADENAVANFVEVPIGANGEISIFNSAGTTDVLVDVEGWVAPATSTAGYYIPLSAPARIADTRPNSGYQGQNSPVTPTSALTIQVEGQGGVPSTGVSAVVINLTATGGTTNGGYLTAYPTGATKPSASTVNFDANQTVPNRAIVALSSNGQITISYGPSGSVNVIVDVSGYFTSSSSTSQGYMFHPVLPARILDTRSGSSYQGAGTTLVPNTPFNFQVTGLGEIPSNAVAVLGNATVTQTTANNGYITIYPYGLSQKPPTSDLNWMAGETVANAVLVTLGTNGKLTAETEISSCALIMDVFGWYG